MAFPPLLRWETIVLRHLLNDLATADGTRASPGGRSGRGQTWPAPAGPPLERLAQPLDRLIARPLRRLGPRGQLRRSQGRDAAGRVEPFAAGGLAPQAPAHLVAGLFEPPLPRQ